MTTYEGPTKQAENVIMNYSEGAVRKVVLKANTLMEFKNGNREFPNGIYLEFFDEEGTLSTTLKANHAYFNKVDNLWRATGNVIVKSFEKKQQLNTEELFWKPDKKKIYTEKFATVTLDDHVVNGTGFETDQDFTYYSFKNTSGEFSLE